MTLRLNSGTNVLPKGLKCFVKIAPVMPPVQSALFYHHHQSDHLYHPHPQLNSSVTDLKSMNTAVLPSPPPSQNTLPNYDSRLLAVTLHAPKKSALETSNETKSDVGDDDDNNDDKDDSLLFFHLDRQIEPFGTYELTLVLKSAYSRAQVCSINQWAAVSSSFASSSALNFFFGPSLAALLNLNSKPSSNSRDYQLTVSWTASQVSTSDQQTSSVSTTSLMMMMMMAANCTFTLYAPFHLFTKLHSVGGAGRKLLEVGLLGATDLINGFSGRAVVVRRPELSHHAQHQKMMAKLAVTTLNVAQNDQVDLGPLGPLPSNAAGKGVLSSSVSNIHFKPIQSGRSDQQNALYPLKANTEQHFLWEFESGGDHRTAPLSLANLKRFITCSKIKNFINANF